MIFFAICKNIKIHISIKVLKLIWLCKFIYKISLKIVKIASNQLRKLSKIGRAVQRDQREKIRGINEVQRIIIIMESTSRNFSNSVYITLCPFKIFWHTILYDELISLTLILNVESYKD